MARGPCSEDAEFAAENACGTDHMGRDIYSGVQWEGRGLELNEDSSDCGMHSISERMVFRGLEVAEAFAKTRNCLADRNWAGRMWGNEKAYLRECYEGEGGGRRLAVQG